MIYKVCWKAVWSKSWASGSNPGEGAPGSRGFDSHCIFYMSENKKGSGAEGSRQKKNDGPLPYDHPMLVKRREALSKEINKNNYKVDPFRFKKTIKDKVELANAKRKHNKKLMDLGFLPSKRINVSAPQRLMLWTTL